MNRPHDSADQTHNPYLTVAACIFVILLSYLFSCVTSADARAAVGDEMTWTVKLTNDG